MLFFLNLDRPVSHRQTCFEGHKFLDRNAFQGYKVSI